MSAEALKNGMPTPPANIQKLIEKSDRDPRSLSEAEHNLIADWEDSWIDLPKVKEVK